MNILNTIGNTPLIKLNGIYIKLETTNPSGSIKDRMVKYIIERAEKLGRLKRGQKILEVTSGNTGISLAMISAIKGYEFTAIMPESMSIERRRMIKAFGGKIILTPANQDIAGAVKKYKELIKQKNTAFLPKQFENIHNIEAHEKGLGQELLSQIDKVDAFVAGAGTGGTVIGVAKALKEHNPKIHIAAVEPKESAVLSSEPQGLHSIQGIGEGFIPHILQKSMDLIDEVITIKSSHAIKKSQQLARKHGILVGVSSGANFLAALQLKKRFQNIVTIFPDRGERYLN